MTILLLLVGLGLIVLAERKAQGINDNGGEQVNEWLEASAYPV